MKPTQYALCRAGMIVLKKIISDARMLERGDTVRLREETAMITVSSWCDSDDLWDNQRFEVKRHGIVCWMRTGY